jgi:hypothetical protein
VNDARNTGPTLVERAAAILRDELEHGALGNVAAASAGWSTQRRDPFATGLNRRLRADLESLLEPLLDVLAPPPRERPSSRAAERSSPLGAIPVLRARDTVAPGQTAEIRTRLRNDGPDTVELGFLCGDLVAEQPGDRIYAGRIRLRPTRIHLAPGEDVDVAISLDVPRDARPGVYQTLLQATELMGVRALLTFPVG